MNTRGSVAPALCEQRRRDLSRRGAPRVRIQSAALAAAMVGSLVGCAAPPRPELSEAELAARSSEDTQQSRQVWSRAIDRMFARANREYEQSGAESTLHILAISGGADWGAFGAGFLVGWGSAAGEASRPDFDVVTGVSTGALIAPFAVIGTDESLRAVESLYREPQPDWARSRGPLFFLPSNASFMEIPGLNRDIRRVIDARMLDQIAQASAQGKIAVVSATDLDLGRQRLWELGSEAELAIESRDPERFHRVLLASASIPVAFPPIEIDDGLYGDGGVTANILLRLDVRDPDAFLQRWRRLHPDRPVPKVRYWIIFNNQVHQSPRTVQARWPAVVAPSLNTSVRSATLAEIRWLAAAADFANAAYGTDIEVRVAAIPDEWRAPAPGDFQRDTMNSLADLGRRMGADPGSWTLWTLPKGWGSLAPDEIVPTADPSR